MRRTPGTCTLASTLCCLRLKRGLGSRTEMGPSPSSALGRPGAPGAWALWVGVSSLVPCAPRKTGLGGAGGAGCTLWSRPATGSWSRFEHLFAGRQPRHLEKSEQGLQRSREIKPPSLPLPESWRGGPLSASQTPRPGSGLLNQCPPGSSLQPTGWKRHGPQDSALENLS